ncbi:excitatory amino acid transporter 2-like [Physella acuta]|uniref:excitatory amino acid transporter 2-like n=1 Tax=Physella acuta TaxID=109671 RepID=UPI0027DB55F7|nr:excitatory amino acid transporter 2-like [Physella acuta]XP_059156430.1 excitatory amino acid transporter 2-like [Physella acuta]XP_059156431.1 excitatory amino acid transporter 2-like [Physella acuta]XP_059156432.1 excitatory amino acid transporter 2-like [Physella acuta]
MEGARSFGGRCCTCCRNNLLVFLTLMGVAVGGVLGFTVRQAEPSQDVIIWLGLPGEVYMRMLKMMILPLIISSVITGTASLDPKCNGRVSFISLVYIVVSNSLSCVVPIAIALTLRPGDGTNLRATLGDRGTMLIETSDIFVDLIRNLFPENVVTACFQQAQTTYRARDFVLSNQSTGDASNQTWRTVNTTRTLMVKGVGITSSTNVLGLVLCCMIFGMASASVGPVAKPFLAFFFSANEIIMKILRWFVWVTPVGVASLIAVAFLQTSDLDSSVRSLGMFSLSVLASLAVHQFLILPAVHFILIRENPFSFLLTLGRPWLVSFAAASSAVAIPETLRALEEEQHIDKRITRFVVPFATTINRDGSCIFIVCSCVFIGQLVGADLHAGRIVLLWVLTSVVSLAIPSVPSAGVVAVVINLTALGIPADLVGLLFATEWLLDRFRSGTNMLSHGFCAMVTYRYCKSYLQKQESYLDDIELDVSEPMVKSKN